LTADLAPVARVGGLGDVAADELTSHRQVERRAEHDVDLVHGLGGEAGAVPPSGLGERVVEAVEVVGSQAPKRNVTEGRVDVVVDEPGVAVGGRSADVTALDR
jgi:hypothetical protein